jgi:hypothetical protein
MKGMAAMLGATAFMGVGAFMANSFKGGPGLI